MLVKAKTFSSDAVTDSGPTYIAIRSAKYLGWSTYCHLADMKRIREPPEFEISIKNSKNEEKPVMIVSVDGVRMKILVTKRQFHAWMFSDS